MPLSHQYSALQISGATLFPSIVLARASASARLVTVKAAEQFCDAEALRKADSGRWMMITDRLRHDGAIG